MALTQQQLRGGTIDRTQRVQQAEVSRQQQVAIAQEEAKIQAAQLKQQQEIAAQQKAQQEYNNAVASVERAARDGPGALGLLATYGEGIERDLARQILKQSNISPGEAIANIQLKAVTSTVGSGNVYDAFSGSQLAGRTETGTYTQTTMPVIRAAETLAPKAPTTYGEFTKDSVIKGTLSYLGYKAAQTPVGKAFTESVGVSTAILAAGTSKKLTLKDTAVGSVESAKVVTPVVFAATPYFTPAGPALMVLGGIETTVRSPTIGGKALGVIETGLGAYGVAKQIEYVKGLQDIKKAKTVFYATEKQVGETSQISTISKTQIGKERYYGLSKSLVKPIETSIGKVEAAASKGVVVKGGKIYPIDVVPTKELAISKQVGGATLVKSGTGFKISAEQGTGVITSAKIKTMDVGVSSAKSVGGFKPVKEGLFTYIGGTTPKIRVYKTGKETLVSATNIVGFVKQKVEPAADTFFGGTKLEQVSKLSPVTEKITAGQALIQRTKAIDIATKELEKGKYIPILIGKGGGARNIYEQLTKTKTLQVTSPKQETRQIKEVITIPKVEQSTLVVPSTITIIRQAEVPKLAVATIPIVSQATNLRSASLQITAPKEIGRGLITPFVAPKESITSYLKSKRKRKTIFEALSKRFGKELSLGKFESQEAAESKLGGFLRGTLAASGKIKREGVALPFTALKSFKGLEFRPAKRSMTTIVQRRGYRLGARAERIEIGKAKRSKIWR